MLLFRLHNKLRQTRVKQLLYVILYYSLKNPSHILKWKAKGADTSFYLSIYGFKSLFVQVIWSTWKHTSRIQLVEWDGVLLGHNKERKCHRQYLPNFLGEHHY